MERLRVWLLVAWMALLGADRIDLLSSVGPFRITPFLVLTPLVVAAEILRQRNSTRPLSLSGRAMQYGLLVTLLVALSLVSVFFAYDQPLSAKRLSLLLLQVYGTLLVVLLLRHRDDTSEILVRGAYWGIAIGVLFNVAQTLVFLGGGGAQHGEVAEGIVFLRPWMYGPWVPRLSGAVLDMNRGGFVFLLYIFLLMRFAPRSRGRRIAVFLAVLSIILTLSRSAILALLVTSLLLFLQQRSLRLTRRGVLVSGVAVGSVAAVLLAFPRAVAGAVDSLLPALTLRFLGDASSSMHFDLIRHGVEVATSSVSNTLFGLGFGSSYAVLESFFPGNKYGNFHSLYISFWVETGIVSLCIALILMLHPFLRSGRYRPLLAGLLAFSVFYQTTLEPAFWFLLAVAWVEPARGSGAGDRSIEPQSEPADIHLQPVAA